MNAVASISHTFTFGSPDRALLFVRQVIVNCQDVATFRDENVVSVIAPPSQTNKLIQLARTLGSSSIPPPLPSARVSRLPTLPEAEEETSWEIVNMDDDEEPEG